VREQQRYSTVVTSTVCIYSINSAYIVSSSK
jgi:hypothetical protein